MEDPLKKDETVNTHQRNLEILATEIYKVKTDLSPDTMQYIFHFVEKHYKLRNNSTLKRCNLLVHLGRDHILSQHCQSLTEKSIFY